MFSSISYSIGSWFRKPRAKILMCGLDASGKTSIIYNLVHGKMLISSITIGVNVDSVSFGNFTLDIWDIGKSQIYQHYYESTRGLVFVVDSVDPDRFNEAKESLKELLQVSQLQNTIILVLANKQDLANAANIDELSKILGLSSINERKWLIKGTSANTGEGILGGFEWLSQQIQKEPDNPE